MLAKFYFFKQFGVTDTPWFKPQVKSPRTMIIKRAALLQRFILGGWSVVVGGCLSLHI